MSANVRIENQLYPSIPDLRARTLELVNVKLCNLRTYLTCRLEIHVLSEENNSHSFTIVNKSAATNSKSKLPPRV